MIQLNTTLVAVTVYPDRARITRKGSLNIESGLHQLEITELPIQINPDTLRASAYGTAQARLLGVQARRTFFTETPTEQVQRLESQVEAAQDEIKRLDAHTELLKHSRAMLDKLAGHTEIYATALAAGEMGVDAQLALFEGLRVRAEKLDEEILNLASSRRKGERAQLKLTKELEQLRSARPRERYTASVEVEISKAGELTLELIYVVSGAQWKPFYDLRLLEGETSYSLEVNYLAQVSQVTGENWNNVTLTLSTARPALARTLPELDPWYIRPPAPIVPARAASFVPQAGAPPAAMLRAPVAATSKAAPAPQEEIHEAEVATATVESSDMAVTYAIPGLINIPADGSPQKVTVARFPLLPRLDYVTAPKLAEAVYRRAKVTNDSPYTFLVGETNLFVGDEFIGSSSLELTAPQGELELYLGNEDRIKVERELKRRDVDKRFIGGKRHMAYGYEIKLENLLPFNIKLTLHDQFPVSRHEEIKVRLDSADPKPAEQTELNLLNWEFSLEPKENRTVRFEFSIESPQGMEIIGLP